MIMIAVIKSIIIKNKKISSSVVGLHLIQLETCLRAAGRLIFIYFLIFVQNVLD